MVSGLKEFLVRKNIDWLVNCYMKHNSTGTSIGFKNIASKIAYDLRLWLNRQTAANNSTNNNNQLIATSKNNQSSSATNDKQSTTSLLDIMQSDELCDDDVIEILLNECAMSSKTTKDEKK